MDIDWSKAPEGATHFDAAESRISSFMKLEGGDWFFWPPSSFSPAWTLWRPDTVDVGAMIPRPSIAAWTGEDLPQAGDAMSNGTGGAAFPLEGSAKRNAQAGMTLRDYFAAKAMQGWSSNPIPEDSSIQDVAAWAYRQADAMLAARSEP